MVAYLSLSYPLLLTTYDCTQNFEFGSSKEDSYASLGYFSYNAPKTRRVQPYRFYPSKINAAQGTAVYSKLSVFKGRQAKLNQAIINTLAIDGALTKSELHKHLSKRSDLEGTHFSSLSKRIDQLEKTGIVNQVSIRQPKHGSKAPVYDLYDRAYLATFLKENSPEKILNNVAEKGAIIVLCDLICYTWQTPRVRHG